jgi:hypothetical protein
MPSQEYIDSHQHEVDTGADNIPSQYDNDDQCYTCGVIMKRSKRHTKVCCMHSNKSKNVIRTHSCRDWQFCNDCSQYVLRIK